MILSFGGHLGRHLEYFNFPKDAKVASFRFNVRTYWRTHLCKNILCGLLFGLYPKSAFGNQTNTAIHIDFLAPLFMSAFVSSTRAANAAMIHFASFCVHAPVKCHFDEEGVKLLILKAEQQLLAF